MAFGGQAGADRLAFMQLESTIARDKMGKEHDLSMDQMAHDEDMRQKQNEGMTDVDLQRAQNNAEIDKEIGRASCRERG